MKRLIAAVLFVCGTLTATTITGTFADASGTPRSGSVFISWPRYVTAGGTVVPAGSTSSAIVAGKMSVVLDAVDTATSGGRVGVHYFTVRYSWDTSKSYAWRVITSATPVDVTLVETDVPASGSAVLPMVALAQIGIGGAASGDMLRWNGSTYAPWNPTTTTGDMIYRSASGITRLAAPSNGTYCITWASGTPSWTSCGGVGGSGAWGSITGTLSDQTDLQNALNAKAASSHTHAGTDIASGTVAVARLPVLVGDSGSGGTAGIAPAPSTGDAEKFLKGDGTWAAAPSGFANPMTTRGDLIYYGAAGTTRLPLGTNGYCLKSNGTDLEYATCSIYSDPLTTLGDVLYRGASSSLRLAGNTTTTRKFLRQTGTGSVSAAPAWDTLTATDLPAPGVGAKGGVEAKACSGTDKVSSIGTDGVPVCAADNDSGMKRFAPTSGSGSTYAGTVTGGGTYANGLTLEFVPDVTNSGGGVNLNVNTQGNRALYRRSGGAPAASYLKAGKPYVITYEDGAFYLNEQDFAVGANATLAFDWTKNPPELDTTNLVCITTGTCAPTGYQDQSGASWRPPEKTVSTLPTAASNTGKVFIVTDGTSVTDCTVGGGSTRAFCVSNGFAWVTLAGAGGSSQRTLLYESLNQSPVTGDGNQKTFASYEIASGTLTTGDKIQVEALLLRTGTYSAEPNFGMILGNGGLPMSGYGTNSNIVQLNIEWQVTNGTTVVGSGWGNRGTAFAVDTTDEYKYTATTNFDTSAANTVTLRTESVHIATDEVVRLVYFRVWRLRP